MNEIILAIHKAWLEKLRQTYPELPFCILRHGVRIRYGYRKKHGFRKSVAVEIRWHEDAGIGVHFSLYDANCGQWCLRDDAIKWFGEPANPKFQPDEVVDWIIGMFPKMDKRTLRALCK